jgi:hypothetical protein
VRNKSNSRGIGQFVGQWKIKNKKFSPNPAALKSLESGIKNLESDENSQNS